MFAIRSLLLHFACLLTSQALKNIRLSSVHGKFADTTTHPWKNNAPVNSANADDNGDDRVVNVYFFRHGETDCNSNWDTCFSDRDQHINAKGLHQAIATRSLINKLGLFNAASNCNVQVAVSLLSRCFDSTLIALQPWLDTQVSQPCFRLHELPALMEGNLRDIAYSNRKPGVAVDHPVRWVDSVLSTDLHRSSDVDTVALNSNFYFTAHDKNISETAKPAEVLTHYRRFPKDACTDQIGELRRYLLHAALAGKTKVFLGTSGSLIACAAGLVDSGNSVQVPTDRGGFLNSTEPPPNGWILHMRMRVSVGKSVNFDFEKAYANPVMTA